MSKLHPMKNLKNLITEDGFDFGIEQFSDCFDEMGDVEPIEQERQKEMLKKATKDFPNLVPLEIGVHDLQIARIDLSTFSKVTIFQSPGCDVD